MPSTSASPVDRVSRQDSPEHSLTVRLAGGRSLKLGPNWTCSDATVLFDRHSGDYWVVSLLAVELIKLLQGDVALSIESIELQLQEILPELDLSADLPPTLQSLADNGLVLLKS